MAIAVTIETTVACPPADVYSFIADIDAWPSWLVASGIVRVQRSATGPLVEGERLSVEQHAAGRAGTFGAQVTAIQPPARLALNGRDGDGVSIDIEANVAPDGDAGARLRWSIRIGLPLRYRMFESMARPQVERAAALDIEGLRRRLESTATD
jgi:uncharacterized protein YndB with AHSA1/START domain